MEFNKRYERCCVVGVYFNLFLYGTLKSCGSKALHSNSFYSLGLMEIICI